MIPEYGLLGMPMKEDPFEGEGETEFSAPDRRRMKMARQAYEEAEREGKENERNNSGDQAGGREDILQF